MAAVGDTHTNSTIGVNTPVVQLRDGDEWRAGKAARWLWQQWLDHWDWIAGLVKEYSADLLVLANGDLIDDPYHPTSKVVSKSKDIILEDAAAVFERPREMADAIIVIGGTDAHAGIDHWLEEILAHRLDAVPDEARGAHAWTHFTGNLRGVRFDVCHHPETKGYLPHTEHSALPRQSKIIKDRYVEMRRPVPDVAIRSHVHYAGDSGRKTFPRVFFTHPWQLTHATTFGKRLGKGYFIRPVGGWVFIIEDGRYMVQERDYQAPAGDEWTM